MTVADYVAGFLKINGVKHIFGVPGGENVLFLDALRSAGLDFVLFSHEAPAGFAACVTGELTGIPGVCLSTVGPGAVNLAAAAAAATLERSPMLAITAEIETTWSGRVTHMVVDLPDLFAPVTKSSFNLKSSSVPTILPQAWTLAISPPAGAVHLSLSPDIAAMPLAQIPDRVRPELSPPLDEQNRSRLFRELSEARRIVLIIGPGLEATGMREELVNLAERWQAIVAVTPKAKGLFPEDHPLFVGCFTAYGDTPIRKAIATSDLVLGVGLDSVDFVTSTWDFDIPVINLCNNSDGDPALNPSLTINGDIKEIVHNLAIADSSGNARQEKSGFVANIRSEITRQLRPPSTISSPPGVIPVYDLIDSLQQVLPEDTAITLDVGVFKLVFLQQWRAERPKSLFVANGLSAMGYALPGAIAIRQAQPDRPVLAIVGDGALLMYAGELATVARTGHPLVVLVVVDQALSLIRLKQLRQGVPIYGTEFANTDLQALAIAFHFEYRLVDSVDTAVDIFTEAMQLPVPVLVEARITNTDYDHFR